MSIYEKQSVAMIKIVCKECLGWSRIEYTAYPIGPSTPVFCPFCGTDNTPQRSAFERAVMGHELSAEDKNELNQLIENLDRETRR